LPFLLSPPLNALITGLIFYKKWKYAFVAFSVMIVAFLFTPPIWPVTENALPAAAVLFDKIIALLLIFQCEVREEAFVRQGICVLFHFVLHRKRSRQHVGVTDFATPMVYSGIFGYAAADVQFFFLLSPFAYPAVRIIQA